jgi:hypothetical protein
MTWQLVPICAGHLNSTATHKKSHYNALSRRCLIMDVRPGLEIHALAPRIGCVDWYAPTPASCPALAFRATGALHLHITSGRHPCTCPRSLVTPLGLKPATSQRGNAHTGMRDNSEGADDIDACVTRRQGRREARIGRAAF